MLRAHKSQNEKTEISLQIVVIQHDGIASVVLLPRNDKIRNMSYITQ